MERCYLRLESHTEFLEGATLTELFVPNNEKSVSGASRMKAPTSVKGTPPCLTTVMTPRSALLYAREEPVSAEMYASQNPLKYSRLPANNRKGKALIRQPSEEEARAALVTFDTSCGGDICHSVQWLFA